MDCMLTAGLLTMAVYLMCFPPWSVTCSGEGETTLWRVLKAVVLVEVVMYSDR